MCNGLGLAIDLFGNWYVQRKESKMNIFLKIDGREGWGVCTRLVPRVEGHSSEADVEQILLRWEILGKEIIQALQVKTSSCHVKTRITFCPGKWGLHCTKLNIFFLMTLSRTISEEIPIWSSQDKVKIITMSDKYPEYFSYQNVQDYKQRNTEKQDKSRKERKYWPPHRQPDKPY